MPQCCNEDLRIGYNRAANLIEEMEKKGIVGPAEGSKASKSFNGARKILVIFVIEEVLSLTLHYVTNKHKEIVNFYRGLTFNHLVDGLVIFWVGFR